MKAYNILIRFCSFYLTASCKEMYLGLCDKRCSHDFIRLVFLLQITCILLKMSAAMVYIIHSFEYMNLFIHVIKICFSSVKNLTLWTNNICLQISFSCILNFLQSVRILPCFKVRKRELILFLY